MRLHTNIGGIHCHRRIQGVVFVIHHPIHMEGMGGRDNWRSGHATRSEVWSTLCQTLTATIHICLLAWSSG